MSKDPSSENSRKALAGQWRDLCETHLPVKSGDEWRYSRASIPGDPDQGWKLHIAATILTAVETFEKVAPALQKRNLLFKAPVSLVELGQLNSGLYYGYSQVGKFITVYPRDDEDVVSLAETLHILTDGIPAPSIPFDTQYRPGSNIYYRYGAFNLLEIEDASGKKIAVIRNKAGNLVADDRESDGPPDWMKTPFPEFPAAKLADADNPLRSTYKVFRALSQRGKGGVFNAIDLGAQPPRLCIVKEGRRHGEVDWDGLDGFDYVRREASNLKTLRTAIPELPAVYSTFETDGNYYLVTEHIEGKTLKDILKRKQRRISIKKALHLSIEISLLMQRMHAAGWAWHDCKPANLIVTESGILRPVDFEGARTFDDTESLAWGTDEFLPPEWRVKVAGESILSSDLYAIGAMIYFLLSGRYYESENPVPLEKYRRGIPAKTHSLVRALLGPEQNKRPCIERVIGILRGDLEKI